MLSAVYIKGFKTFARPVRMPLTGGVTAVVGPNGSGKSNITDAVLFALGEQSPGLLRAGTMGELIFSGSESLQKTNAAEVTLVLDNSRGNISLPYEEVSVTRRIVREGGTEYRINGSRARLSDVRSVAGEAGLGRHSILRQGAVDAIVAGGAEACRLAVEEAAGLGVYRRRRSAAARRLERATEQLDQSRNIESELAAQLARIEKEAQAAREYREIESSYRKFSLAHLYTVASRVTSGLENRIEAETARADRLDSEAAEAARGEENLAGQIKRAEQEMLRIEKLVEGLEDASESLRRASLLAGRNVMRAESRSGEEDQRDRTLKRLEAESERVGRELKTLRVRFDTATRKSGEMDAERVLAERAYSEVRERFVAIERRHAEAVRSLDRGGARLAAFEVTPALQVMEEADADEIARSVAGLRDAEVGDTGRLGELIRESRDGGKEVSGLRDAANQRRGALQAASRRLDGRIRRLASSRRDSEGPRLYEVLRSRPGYESAVEAALSEYGGGMLAADISEGMNLVSETERVAVRLDASGVEDHRPEPFDGKPLLECVEVIDERFAGAVERLLGGTYLVEEDGVARLDNGHVAVTKSGLRLTRTSVSLVGAGRYTVEAQLAEVRKLLEELDRDPVQKLREVEGEIEESSRRRSNLDLHLDALSSLVGRVERTKNSLVRGLERRLSESGEARRTAQKRAGEVARLRAESEARRDEVAGLSRELDGLRRSRSGAAARRDETRVRAEDATRVLRKVRRALTEGAKRVDSLSSGIERIGNSGEAGIRDPGSVATRAVAGAERLATEISARRQKIRLERAERAEAYRSLSANQNALARKSAELRSEARAVREKVSALEDSLQRSRLSTASAETEIHEEWAATLDDAKRESENLDLAPEKVESERNRLARRLKRFGDVNLLALTQEEEIRERHDTIAEQRTDAEEAAAEIQRIIDEVDREIENRFTATFERVKTTFTEMVPRMLAGGGGSLELTEDGVEVGVRLGRKGWRSLKVLSGGERSLLALSFLFSIILSRTDGAGTFCILDEAEAALDDVNLARFVTVIDSQRERGQFILVTHQKRTMASADVLYGVVQDASGATSVVSKRIQGD